MQTLLCDAFLIDVKTLRALNRDYSKSFNLHPREYDE
jgi:hypothetical protein